MTQSGIAIAGDQRGAATSDYDGDGRPDLAVSQNGAATTLWHNKRAKPGIRVRLDGGPANPLGIGAQLRVLAGSARGPVREVHAGRRPIRPDVKARLEERAAQPTLTPREIQVMELVSATGQDTLPLAQGPRRATDGLSESQLAVYEAVPARRRATLAGSRKCR